MTSRNSVTFNVGVKYSKNQWSKQVQSESSIQLSWDKTDLGGKHFWIKLGE